MAGDLDRLSGADRADRVSTVGALADFEAALRDAAMGFETARTLGDQRLAAIKALVGVQRLMIAQDMSLNLFAPIFAVVAALEQLSQGVVVPLVANGRAKGGRPPVPNHVAVLRALLAAALELRTRAGHSVDDAAAWVARQATDWSAWPTGAKANRPEALKDWRRGLESAPKGGFARSTYAKLVDPAEGATAERVLAIGRSFAATSGSSEIQ